MTNRPTTKQLQEQLLSLIEAPLTKEKPSIGQRFATGAGKIMRGISNVANYDYKKGTQRQQDVKAAEKQAQAQADQVGAQYQKNLAKQQGTIVGKQPTTTKTTPTTQTPTTKTTDPITTAMAQGGTQKPAKRKKTGGKIAGQVSGTDSAKYQRQRRADIKAKKNAVKTGIDTAQTRTTTTAQNVSKKSGVSSAKIGGQKIDLNDPQMQNLRKAIEKAVPGVISGVDNLNPPQKVKLKKAIS